MDKADFYNIIYAARDFIKAHPHLYNAGLWPLVDPKEEEERRLRLNRALVGILFPLVPEQLRNLITTFVGLSQSANITAALDSIPREPTEAAKHKALTAQLNAQYAHARQQLDPHIQDFSHTQLQIIQCLGEIHFDLFERD